MARGGKRDNAGRKKLGEERRVNFGAMVKPDTLRKIRERKGDRSVGQYIDEIVEETTL